MVISIISVRQGSQTLSSGSIGSLVEVKTGLKRLKIWFVRFDSVLGSLVKKLTRFPTAHTLSSLGTPLLSESSGHSRE